jgi:N4-gp56 family major capsid protein
MAKTIIPAELVPKLWEKRLWVEAKRAMFFERFMGDEVPTGDTTSASSYRDIVYVSTDLSKSPGDTITIGLAYQLQGQGVSGNNQMEGNEEAISFYSFSVTLDRIRNAILWDDVMMGQKSPYEIRNTAKTLLADWLAQKLETMIVDALSNSPSSGRVLYGGDATSDDTIDSNDVFSTNLIERAVRKAKLAQPKIRPIKINGKEYYVILAHPYQIKDLRTESAWLQAQREANVRGDENPIFSGAVGVWAGAIIYEYERIKTYSNWGSDGETPGARALLLGAQAVAMCFGKKVYWKERVTDYDSIGVQVGSIVGIAKTKFNNVDYGVIALDTYATE